MDERSSTVKSRQSMLVHEEQKQVRSEGGWVGEREGG